MNIRSAVTLIAGLLLIAGAVVLALATDAHGRAADPYSRCLERGGEYQEWVVDGQVVASRCNARGVQLEEAQMSSCVWVEKKNRCVVRNPVLYVEHVHRRWFFAELADGSAWMVTRCRTDEIPNRRTSCWWNAHTMGNGEGRSFLAINGRRHWAVRGTVVR